MSLTIHTDGGSRHNPGPAASAYVIQEETGRVVHQAGHFLGQATNNQAEYQAVVLSLEWLTQNKFANTSLDYFLDSLLVVNQLSGLYKVKDRQLSGLVLKIHQLIKTGGFLVRYHYVPREQNTDADFLVNQTLDLQN
jgi:ribonuclease HI